MTIDEALEILEHARLMSVFPAQIKFTFDVEGIKALEMAIKALEQTRWIPCNELLPRVGEKVLVTYETFMGNCHVYMAEFNGTMFVQSVSERIFPQERIIAWMPLPEPYKAESEEV